MLAGVERRLHDTALGCRPDDDDAFRGLGFEQELERGVVERGVAMFE
jgi:hypothetical protein